MDCLEAISTRRSVRTFTDAPVTDEQLEMLLRAAMAAPSAGNQQSWRFVVVRDAEKRAAARRGDAVRRADGPRAGRHRRARRHAAETLPGYWVQDCSAAVENLLLAAHATGLGAVLDRRASRRRARARRVAEIVGIPGGHAARSA